MGYYRITLEDGVMHYMTGRSAKSVRRAFQRNYPGLPQVVSVRLRSAA